MSERTCSIDGCNHQHEAHGWCNRHYMRWYRYGDPVYNPPKLSVEERFWSKVDKSAGPDGCWLWTRALVKGYGVFYLDGKLQYAHRVAYELVTGEKLGEFEGDHKCFNPACCNPHPNHVRRVTHKQNIENRKGAQRNSRSGIRGVYQNRNGTWCVDVRSKGVRYVGTFNTVEQATEAALLKRLELFTHNAVDRRDTQS